MKSQATGVWAACILFVLAAGVVSAQTTPPGQASQSNPSSQAAADAGQQVKAAFQQLLDASRKEDVEERRRLMADDLTWVNAAGPLFTRDELLSRKPTPPSQATIDRIRTFGNNAVLTATAQLENGRQVRVIQEWVNRDGQWRLFAHQATAVLPAGTPPVPPPATAGTSGRSAMHGSAPTLSSDVERAVWKAQSDLQRAFLDGDAATYARLTSDDYMRVAAGGQQQDKSEFLENVRRNAKQSPGQLETGDVQIAVSGDAARLVMTTWGTLPGGQAAAPTRVTRLFEKRNGQWQQTAAIFTPVPQQ